MVARLFRYHQHSHLTSALCAHSGRSFCFCCCCCCCWETWWMMCRLYIWPSSATSSGAIACSICQPSTPSGAVSSKALYKSMRHSMSKRIVSRWNTAPYCRHGLGAALLPDFHPHRIPLRVQIHDTVKIQVRGRVSWETNEREKKKSMNCNLRCF